MWEGANCGNRCWLPSHHNGGMDSDHSCRGCWGNNTIDFRSSGWLPQAADGPDTTEGWGDDWPGYNLAPCNKECFWNPTAPEPCNKECSVCAARGCEWDFRNAHTCCWFPKGHDGNLDRHLCRSCWIFQRQRANLSFGEEAQLQELEERRSETHSLYWAAIRKAGDAAKEQEALEKPYGGMVTPKSRKRGRNPSVPSEDSWGGEELESSCQSEDDRTIFSQVSDDPMELEDFLPTSDNTGITP